MSEIKRTNVLIYRKGSKVCETLDYKLARNTLRSKGIKFKRAQKVWHLKKNTVEYIDLPDISPEEDGFKG